MPGGTQSRIRVDEIAHREASSRAVSSCLARSRTRAGQPGASTAARIRARTGAGSRRVTRPPRSSPSSPGVRCRRKTGPDRRASRAIASIGSRRSIGVREAAAAGIQRDDGGQRQDLEHGIRDRLEAAAGGIAAPGEARRVDAECTQQGLGRTRAGRETGSPARHGTRAPAGGPGRSRGGSPRSWGGRTCCRAGSRGRARRDRSRPTPQRWASCRRLAIGVAVGRGRGRGEPGTCPFPRDPDPPDVLGPADPLRAPQSHEQVLELRRLGSRCQAGHLARDREPRLVADAAGGEGLVHALGGLDQRVGGGELRGHGAQESVREAVVEGVHRDRVPLPVGEVREAVRDDARAERRVEVGELEGAHGPLEAVRDRAQREPRVARPRRGRGERLAVRGEDLRLADPPARRPLGQAEPQGREGRLPGLQDPRGPDRGDPPHEHGAAARRAPKPGIVEQAERVADVDGGGRVGLRDRRQVACPRRRHGHPEGVGRRLIDRSQVGHQQPLLLGGGERPPVGHRHDEREPVRERGVERVRAEVRVVGGVLVHRVHRGPAVPEAGQLDPLDPPLVDDREQLVLELRPAAVDLVEEDRLGVPDRGRRPQPVEAPVPVGDRVADEVVVGEQARVVVAPGQAERLRDPRQQQALAGAVRADQEDRQLGRDGRDDDGLDLEPY